MKKKPFPKSDTFIDTFQSPLGNLYLIFSGVSLAALSFERPREPLPIQTSRQSSRLKEQLSAYFKGMRRDFDQSVRFLQGTDFEKKVWLCLMEIPFGETRSYKWVAERIGSPKAVRAVGQALSKNPIPIVLACHRVIESDGSLGGYSGGSDIKRRLLDLEYYARQEAGPTAGKGPSSA